MKTKLHIDDEKPETPAVAVQGLVRAHRPATLKEMGITTDEQYYNYVNDCRAGHAAIYLPKKKTKTHQPVSPNVEPSHGKNDQ